MRKNKIIILIVVLFLILISLTMFSLVTGDVKISFVDVLFALSKKSTTYNNRIIYEIRLPRILAAIFIGGSLSISGLYTSIAMKNSLADSGILGIQSGATVGALVTILVFPSLTMFLPIFSFIGGFTAFGFLVITTSLKGSFQPTKVVLVGVAINSIATSIIGILTILNAYKIKNALTWLNGSLATISVKEMYIIVGYSTIMILFIFLFMPFAKILMLDDHAIKNIGQNPKILRITLSVLAVLLASISVAFVGIISFIGIIAPQIAKRIIKENLKIKIVVSMLIGSILVLSADLLQRIIFSPIEIPVGILIGLIGAPMFIILAGGERIE